MCVTQCVTLELNISEAVLKQEYWIPGAKIKLYAKKFSYVFSISDISGNLHNFQAASEISKF